MWTDKSQKTEEGSPTSLHVVTNTSTYTITVCVSMFSSQYLRHVCTVMSKDPIRDVADTEEGQSVQPRLWPSWLSLSVRRDRWRESLLHSSWRRCKRNMICTSTAWSLFYYCCGGIFVSSCINKQGKSLSREAILHLKISVCFSRGFAPTSLHVKIMIHLIV